MKTDVETAAYSIPGRIKTFGVKGNDANFSRILPHKMAELVAQGLFEPWEGTYRITARGRAQLAELEKRK